MKVTIKLFAAARDAVGRRELVVDLEEGATAADLFEKLAGEFPKLNELAPFLLLSINREYAKREQALSEGDEIALIPPVSGG
ncbi:MAG: MoaD/ThiS family protein [candidate division NC10 bacterium]|nr:MoaD/ThiS family protein [candidate division NC10 bacterium]